MNRHLMPSSLRGYVLGAVRFALVAGGTVVAGAVLYSLLTLPPEPPGGEGFVTGLAYVFGGFIVVFALGAAGLGVVLPTVLGADDPLGFGRYQRGLLKVAGGCFVGGFLVGAALALAVAFQAGLFFWLTAILLGVLAVCVVVAWRLGEVARDALVRAAGRD